MVDRLSGLIEDENAALRARDISAIQTFTARKEHALLELMRYARPGAAFGMDPTAADHLNRLRARLAENMAGLSTYLGAMRELTGAIADGIAEEDSDGTYSRPTLHAGSD